mmetsp:Transcript_20241/g.51094  ORF Transcript_20241/g.51094 Transcript_20241/m.51094 type:complete len:248 (-) Transcript_20241:46-789(-)
MRPANLPGQLNRADLARHAQVGFTGQVRRGNLEAVPQTRAQLPGRVHERGTGEDCDHRPADSVVPIQREGRDVAATVARRQSPFHRDQVARLLHHLRRRHLRRRRRDQEVDDHRARRRPHVVQRRRAVAVGLSDNHVRVRHVRHRLIHRLPQEEGAARAVVAIDLKPSDRHSTVVGREEQIDGNVGRRKNHRLEQRRSRRLSGYARNRRRSQDVRRRAADVVAHLEVEVVAPARHQIRVLVLISVVL